MVREAVLFSTDDWITRKLTRLGADFGLRWVAAVGADVVVEAEPALVVLDLTPPEALGTLRSLRGRWPTAIIAGYLAVPDQERWLAGQRVGCDVVANRGALVARLRPLLAAGGGRGRRTFPVMAEADLAGRLGLVVRVDQTPVGAIAVWHVDGAVYATGDLCPHAGALLSAGEVDRRVVTCPRHGSQFDVCTGERLRGPADVDIPIFPTVVADGQVSIVVEDHG